MTTFLTSYQVLVTLRNEQLEKVLNRKVSVKMLEKMVKEDPTKVLVTIPDMETATMKKVTALDRLKEMIEAEKYDIARLEALDDMIKMETCGTLKNPDGPCDAPDEEKKTN